MNQAFARFSTELDSAFYGMLAADLRPQCVWGVALDAARAQRSGTYDVAIVITRINENVDSKCGDFWDCRIL